jgi:uncharacterized cupin superfamily protein
MTKTFTNIHSDAFEDGTDARGETWKSLDLSGDHLGVYIEELPPGGTSSQHHFHTAEEEHVIVLDGSGVLFLGDEEHVLKAGDHIWFAAGKENAHHIENKSTTPLTFLVFGERDEKDVVFYPETKVIVSKALGRKAMTYREIKSEAFP